MATVTPTGVQGKEFNVNNYATRKTISQGLLDMALLTANVTQLRQCLQYPISKQNIFGLVTMGMIVSSILFQILIGMLCIYLGYGNLHNENRQKRMNMVNNVVTYLTFLVTVINVIISGLGIGTSPVDSPILPGVTDDKLIQYKNPTN